MNKNILFFTKYYYPHVGGVEKHVQKISEILSQKYSIDIITLKHEIGLPETEKIQNIHIYRAPSGDKLKIWFWLLKHFYLIQKADIVHIHDVFYWYLPFRILYPFKKVYMTFHGYEAPNEPNLRQIFWHKVAELLTIGNICIGDFHKKWYGVTPDYVSYGAA